MASNHFPRRMQGFCGILAVCAVMFSAIFSATPSLATPSPSLPSAQTTDLLLGDFNTGVAATAAAGAFSGNDKPNNALTQLNDNDVFDLDFTWTFAGSSDSGNGGPFQSNPQSTTGQLEFDDPITGPFVIALKSSNAFGLYYFANALGNADLLTFTTNGVGLNKHGRPQDLSHASLYVTNSGNTPPGQPPLGPPIVQPPVVFPGTTPGAIPEPGTAALALLGTLMVLRRVRHSRVH